MSQEIINIGTLPNDGEGDPLRVAFQKINNNFTQLFSTGFLAYEATTFSDLPNQVIFEVPADMVTQATFKINSANPDTNDSQNITIDASVQNDFTLAKWTGHSTLFINDPVTTYDVVVNNTSGNFEVRVSPLVDTTLNHYISAQVQLAAFTVGIPLSITQGDEVLTTENDLIITTEN